MQSATFELTILNQDDEDTHLSIVVTTEQYKSSIDDYINIDYFKDFSESLKNFPVNSRECILDFGPDEKRFPTYLFLRAYIYDTLGHAGLEVKMRQNGAPIVATYAHFSIATEVASINAFGEALSKWTTSREDVFSFDFYTGMH